MTMTVKRKRGKDDVKPEKGLFRARAEAKFPSILFRWMS